MQPDQRSDVSSHEAASKPLPAIVFGPLLGIVIAGVCFYDNVFIHNCDPSAVGFCAVFLGGFIALIVTMGMQYEEGLVTWHRVAQGAFDRAEYVPSTDHRLTTIIHFDDGQVCVLTNETHSIGFPRGAKIVIERNGEHNYRIKAQK
ncbi:MAG: hypothetical protein WCT10_05185 [Patescibacteria group bacterium]|jgi:hypothetical protein